MTNAQLDQIKKHLAATQKSWPWMVDRYGEDAAKWPDATSWRKALDGIDALYDNQPQAAVTLYTLTLVPNYVSSKDPPASNYQAGWAYSTSPTTPYLSPDSQKHVQRYLLLDPRMKDSKGNLGCDEWWFLARRLWPASFDPNRHGKWGTEFNLHNVAGDNGPSGGVGWGFGSGVSAIRKQWLTGASAPELACEPAGRSWSLPAPSRDVLHEYLIHMVAGRTDGSTVRPGLLECWADGKPVFSEHDINTVQRAKGPDGQWYTQAWMQGWDGDYTAALPTPSTVSFALTQYGKTRDECLADVPRYLGNDLDTYSWDGVAPDLGPPTLVVSP